MRAMPFRVIPEDRIGFPPAELEVLGRRYRPQEPVTGWDYLVPTLLHARVNLTHQTVLSSTGVPADQVVALLQVDCPSTGCRAITTRALEDGLTEFAFALPSGEIAKELRARVSVVLDVPGDPNRVPVAWRRGSRLASSPPFGFDLEGDGGTFPTEAFEFAPAGLPPGAAWKLNSSLSSLDAPFASCVRLQVNTAHPAASELLSGKPNLAQSVLYQSVLEQLLTNLALQSSASEEDLSASFEEGSVGASLGALTESFLAMSLSEAVAGMKVDPARLVAKLQEGTGFLREGAK